MTPTFRVASYNVHSCVGTDRRCNPERVWHVLREIGPDIVGLQEVGSRTLIDEMEQFHFFEKHLGMTGVAASNPRWGRLHFGNAVFTSGDILDARPLDLTVLPFEMRSAIDCRIKLRGRTVRVIATHLGLFPHERRRQVDLLADVLQERPEELTVLLGDFNVFGLERKVLQRIGAPVQMPKLRTFPSRRPLMSLDRIWTIPNQDLARIHVHRTALSRAASDHLPIVADVSLTPVGRLPLPEVVKRVRLGWLRRRRVPARQQVSS
jgi:endonuclease/exonuclease/phosphatase family metal-dependent hydrolase